jgi:hypothetical protein
MSFVAAATSVGAWALGTGAAAGIGSTIVGGAMIGAGVGGAYSALTGDGNILDSMLTGAGIGGLAGGVGGAFFPGAAGYAAPTTAGTVTGAAANTPAVGAYANPGISTSKQVADFANATSDPIGALAESGALSGGAGQTGITAANTGLNAKEMLGLGLGATTLMGLLGGNKEGIPAQGDKGMIRPYEYSTAKREPAAGESYYFEPIEYDKYGKTTKPINTAERNYFDQKFTALPTYSAAMGGQVPPNLNHMPAGGLSALQGMRDGYAPMTTMDGNIPQFAMGGHLGGYSDGGQLLKGPGDGVSDDIPATINNKQPARLADGEFVIPARIVSEIGNGSTDAGAKRLYAMMDKIQAGRKKTVGKGKVAVDTKAKKHLLA